MILVQNNMLLGFFPKKNEDKSEDWNFKQIICFKKKARHISDEVLTCGPYFQCSKYANSISGYE